MVYGEGGDPKKNQVLRFGKYTRGCLYPIHRHYLPLYVHHAEVKDLPTNQGVSQTMVQVKDAVIGVCITVSVVPYINIKVKVNEETGFNN